MCKQHSKSTKNIKNCPDEFIRAIKEFAHDFGYVITSSKNIKYKSTGQIKILSKIKEKFLLNFKKEKTITIKFRLIRIDKQKEK